MKNVNDILKDGNEAEIGKALFSAMNQNNLDDFNLILEDPKCTTEMLAKSYDDNNSVLEHAVTTQVDEMFLSSILNSPKFTTKLLLTEYPLLMLAIHSGNRDTVKLILDSPKCTTDVLLMRPEKLDMNPFLFAVEQRLPNILKDIFKCSACTPELYESTNSAGQTAIMIAVANEDYKCLKEILQQSENMREHLSFNSDGKWILNTKPLIPDQKGLGSVLPNDRQVVQNLLDAAACDDTDGSELVKQRIMDSPQYALVKSSGQSSTVVSSDSLKSSETSGPQRPAQSENDVEDDNNLSSSSKKSQ